MSVSVNSLPDPATPWPDQLEDALQAARNELRAIAALPLRTGYRIRIESLLARESALLVQIAAEVREGVAA